MTSRAFSRRRVLDRSRSRFGGGDLAARRAYGSDWRPTETVRLIVPAAAGGSTDVMGRLLAAHLQTAWGQSAVVENRSGGGGTIGTAEVVRSKADGHTILVGNPGPNAIAYSIFRNMTYKAEQLQPVSNMIRIPNIVSAHPSTGIKSIAGTDRLHQGQSGQADLRLLRRRAEPSPHRRLVPAAHRTEDGRMCRSAAPVRRCRRRWPATSRSCSTTSIRRCRRCRTASSPRLRSPRRSAARRRPTFRPCARARRNWQSSTSRPGSASSCRRAAPAAVVEALNKEIKAMLDARGHQEEHRQRWAHAPTTARRSNSPISCRRRRRSSPSIIKQRRPADGRELRRRSVGR